MKSILKAFFLVFLVAVSVQAVSDAAKDAFQQGLAAYNRGDYATALKHWRPLAEQGDAWAQNNLGVMYAKGRGVPQDDKEAIRWFRKAAEQGNANAQAALGVMYEEGRGVPQDFKEAIRWFRKAAEQGDAGAQAMLGIMYEGGRGVPQDKVLAYALYNLSAATGSSDVSNLASKNRAQLLEELTPAELEAGQALTRELMKPGNFAQALDAWQRR
jgi:TPR repeat protein